MSNRVNLTFEIEIGNETNSKKVVDFLEELEMDNYKTIKTVTAEGTHITARAAEVKDWGVEEHYYDVSNALKVSFPGIIQDIYCYYDCYVGSWNIDDETEEEELM